MLSCLGESSNPGNPETDTSCLRERTLYSKTITKSVSTQPRISPAAGCIMPEREAHRLGWC